jgi:hypothetical protein
MAAASVGRGEAGARDADAGGTLDGGTAELDVVGAQAANASMTTNARVLTGG